MIWKRKDIRFGLRFTFILKCEFHQNNNILSYNNIGLKGCNWPSKFITIIFCLGAKSRP
jgi:hypothetical protein